MVIVQKHLFTDADNTLWDTNAVFAAAQLGLLRAVETVTGLKAPEAEDQGLAFLRDVDQRIAAAHSLRLGYPPHMLAQALAFALSGSSATRAAGRAVGNSNSDPDFDSAVALHIEKLRERPVLRCGVREGLEAIANAGVPITVVTEDKFDRCRALIEAHGLIHLIADVVSIRKTPDAYTDLRQPLAATHAFMVGDQPDRDIAAAALAGFETIYFPSAFLPFWNTDVEVRPDHKITRFDEIIPLVSGPDNGAWAIDSHRKVVK
ncbi:HAD family hydrolase [Mesorhizobium sp. LNJC405B00]|uniref:HAD family hydrolase n=1 Tax=Mesorhizobium sp. LNJC405B00 TaxID=1287281 RepID=UPI0003CEFE68|nr:HAD family hydrolase [Mesorhizobium sp. LNJC405B00]ESY01497.1 hypothetical protein X755_06865 [Mesorhizobium sp. LNJC405B00]